MRRVIKRSGYWVEGWFGYLLFLLRIRNSYVRMTFASIWR